MTSSHVEEQAQLPTSAREQCWTPSATVRNKVGKYMSDQRIGKLQHLANIWNYIRGWEHNGYHSDMLTTGLPDAMKHKSDLNSSSAAG